MTLGLQAQIFNPQTKEITEKFFPDPDVEILTPAFKKKKGFTKYNEMMSFLDSLQNQNETFVQIKFIGNSQKGKKIPLVTINKNPSKDKIRVWIQAGIHGNEPASTEGILYFMQQLLIDNKENQELLDELEIAIVPMANIDGYEIQERFAANGLDLNRDQTKLTIPESIVLKQAFTDFNAQVALDFHEYNPFRSSYLDMGKAGFTMPYDVMFLYSGNLNHGKTIRNYTEDIFVDNAKRLLTSNSLTHHDYFTTSIIDGDLVYNQGSVNSRASATSYALTNCISTLVEVRGVNLDRTSFKRRIMTTFYIAKSYLQTAVSEKKNLMKILAESENEVKQITLKSKRQSLESNVPFIDLSNTEIENVRVNMNNALRSKSTQVRPIPVAYILLPEQTEIADKLKVLGIKIEQLTNPIALEVEAYKVIDYKKDAVKFEDVYMQDVKTTLEPVIKNFPANSFIVYTDQKNKGLLFEVLEPEAANSFVSYSVVKTDLGEELPFYRYNKAKF